MFTKQLLVAHALFLSNLVYIFLGLAFIVVGKFGIDYRRQFEQTSGIYTLRIDDHILNLFLISMIIWGSIVSLNAILGCFAAWKVSEKLLTWFAGITLLLSVLVVYILLVWHYGTNEIRDATHHFMNDTFEDHTNNKILHDLEASLQCCGTTGPDSYEGVLPVLPPTCCQQEETIDYEKECLLQDAFSIGCLKTVSKYVDKINITFTLMIIIQMLYQLIFMEQAVFYLFETIAKNIYVVNPTDMSPKQKSATDGLQEKTKRVPV